MNEVRLGVRAHDLKANSLQELGRAYTEFGIDNLQFAPKKLPFIAGSSESLEYGFTTYLDKKLEKLRLNIPILGCYVNIIDPDKNERKKNLRQFENYLNAATYFKRSPVVATETGSISEDGFTTANYSDRVFEKVIESVKKLICVAEKLGVSMAIEPGINHPIYNFKRTRELFSKVSSPNLKLIFDPENLITIHNSDDQHKIIDDFYDYFGDKIIAVHLKDFIIQDRKIKVVPFGLGNFDQEYFLKETAKKHPYMFCLLEGIEPEQIPNAVDMISKWVMIQN